MSSPAKQPGAAEKLPDGTVIRLRLIRPEDERLLQEFAAHMSPEDFRLRFFAAMRGLSHKLAARLSHIDYDRDIAVLAFAEDAEEVLGVARFAGDPDNHVAEFAIAVRTDWKRHGLGHLLMALPDPAGAATRHRSPGWRDAARKRGDVAAVPRVRFYHHLQSS